MTAEQSRQTGGYYAQQWTVRDEYAMGAMVAEANAAGRHGTSIDPAQLAQWSFRIADAMLAERRRKPETVAAPPTGNPKYPDAADGICEDSDSLHQCDADTVCIHDCGVGCHVNLPAHEGEF